MAFDPRAWDKELKRTIAPELFKAMAEGAAQEEALKLHAYAQKIARGERLPYSEKYSPDQPRDEQGRFGTGGAAPDRGDGSGAGGTAPKEAIPRSRAERAKAAYNPSTKEKQDKSEAYEKQVTKKIDGEKSDDNRPMDIIVDGKHGVELKVMHDAKEGRVNMRQDSRERKEAWAKEQKGRTLHTILIDNRDKYQSGAHADKYSGHKIYYAQGVGAFRLGTMTKVENYAELNKLIRGE